MILTPRRIIYASAVVILIASHFWMYRQGINAERLKSLKAVEEFREKESKLIGEVENAKRETKIVYRDRIKTVYESSGVCLSSRIPEPLLSSLLDDKIN